VVRCCHGLLTARGRGGISPPGDGHFRGAREELLLLLLVRGWVLILAGALASSRPVRRAAGWMDGEDEMKDEAISYYS
jgi:hypothetical protein